MTTGPTILPPSHQAESDQGLNVTGDAHSPQIRPNLSVNTDQPAIIEVPDSAEIEGSENNPILLDNGRCGPMDFPKRHSSPRRNVGPPNFFGDRRFIDVVLKKDDRTTESVAVLNQTRATLFISSHSDLLTPLAEAPPIPTLVAETTLTWTSKKSCPLKRANFTPIMSILKNTPSGSYLSLQHTIHNTLDEVEKTSDISSTIDPDVKARLDDFDAKLN